MGILYIISVNKILIEGHEGAKAPIIEFHEGKMKVIDLILLAQV